MAILVKGKTFTSTEQVTSAKLHQLVDSATFDPGAADGSTLEVSGGALRVKDAGVITAKIADLNITTAKIADSNITTAKIADANVTVAKLSPDIVFGMKNRLINGAFNINQAGATSAADAAYHLDQWYALTETSSVTIAQQTDQENGQPTSLRMTQPDVTAKRMGSAQPIESINCRDLRGQTVALRARIRCSSSQAIRWAVVEWTGAADAITKDIVNTWSSATFTTGNFFISTTTTIAATGSVTPSANTWTDLLASATISSSANNLIVFIWSEGTLSQNATLDLGLVQLAQGAQTPLEARPVGLELALAQRYFQIIGNFEAVGVCVSTTQGALSAFFKTNMRSNPSVTIPSGTLTLTRPFFGNFTSSTLACDQSTTTQASFSFTSTSLTTGQAANNAGNQITLSARL